MLKGVPRRKFISNVGSHGKSYDSFKVPGSRNEPIQPCGDTSGGELDHIVMYVTSDQKYKLLDVRFSFPRDWVQVVVPVGEIPPETLAQYCRLVTRHRQVELQLLRSFYKELQKSPFTFFPWKNGFMHFRFLPVRMCEVEDCG